MPTEGENVAPYDPMEPLRSSARSVAGVADDIAVGRTGWGRPSDVANSLDWTQRLAAALADVVRHQAEALPGLTGDPRASEAAKLMSVAAATAAQLTDELKQALDAAGTVR
ncbi:hypothetical protein AB0K51_14650 [Kitasatospora sp. NPDC049285]|uniref:hypothetical protein n=1 Tax=Kitasatospora sp. NPDC049285 TaxID=3157096 RepID=UPI00343965F7